MRGRFKISCICYIQPKSLAPEDFLAFYITNTEGEMRKETFTNDIFSND